MGALDMLRTALIVVVVAWVAVVALAAVYQRNLLYFPDTARIDPAALGLDGVVEEIVPTPDGARLVTWWSAPRPGHPVVLYFHGNGGNLANRQERVRLFRSTGAGVLMMSYRGYGGSTGLPTETAIKSDAELMIERLASKGIAADRIVAFGESLGTGVAVYLAARNPLAGIILDSPYTSLPEVAGFHYPYLPVSLLMRDRFDSLALIPRVTAPLLVVHGTADTTVPTALGRRLFEAARGPKQFVALEGHGHVVPLKYGAWDAIAPFLARLIR